MKSAQDESNNQEENEDEEPPPPKHPKSISQAAPPLTRVTG